MTKNEHPICTGTIGHHVYGPTRRYIACSTCGSAVVDPKNPNNTGSLPLHNILGQRIEKAGRS